MEKWALVSVLCTDGQTRLGIEMEIEAAVGVIIQGGLHEEYASAICDLKAKEMGLEVFDNTNPDYDMQEIIEN